MHGCVQHLIACLWELVDSGSTLNPVKFRTRSQAITDTQTHTRMWIFNWFKTFSLRKVNKRGIKTKISRNVSSNRADFKGWAQTKTAATYARTKTRPCAATTNQVCRYDEPAVAKGRCVWFIFIETSVTELGIFQMKDNYANQCPRLMKWENELPHRRGSGSRTETNSIHSKD